MGGEEAFEVEHFKPRSKFPDLDRVYGNLYYVCRGCNAHKSETWPSDEMMATGMRFADPCESDPYVVHFSENADGSVGGVTRCGIDTDAHIRLSREALKRWRQARAKAEAEIPDLSSLKAFLKQIGSAYVDAAVIIEIEAQISALDGLISEMKRRFRIEGDSLAKRTP